MHPLKRAQWPKKCYSAVFLHAGNWLAIAVSWHLSGWNNKSLTIHITCCWPCFHITYMRSSVTTKETKKIPVNNDLWYNSAYGRQWLWIWILLRAEKLTVFIVWHTWSFECGFWPVFDWDWKTVTLLFFCLYNCPNQLMQRKYIFTRKLSTLILSCCPKLFRNSPIQPQAFHSNNDLWFY